jgi:histone-lysine N-methyltransferase SETMAR
MKCRHLRWMPHTLTGEQKVVRAELPPSALQALAKHQHTHFHFSFTGDETWMFSTHDHRTMWIASWDDVEEIGRSSHFQQKTMVTILFNGTRGCKIAILPQGHKMNRTSFIGCVVQSLVEICSPDGRKIHERKVMLHFHNGPIHNAGGVQEHLMGLGFKRLEHSPYSLDLAPCDFFLSGAMKGNVWGQRFDSLDGLFDAGESYLLMSCRQFFKNGYETYDYALKSAPCMLICRYVEVPKL